MAEQRVSPASRCRRQWMTATPGPRPVSTMVERPSSSSVPTADPAVVHASARACLICRDGRWLRSPPTVADMGVHEPADRISPPIGRPRFQLVAATAQPPHRVASHPPNHGEALQDMGQCPSGLGRTGARSRGGCRGIRPPARRVSPRCSRSACRKTLRFIGTCFATGCPPARASTPAVGRRAPPV